MTMIAMNDFRAIPPQLREEMIIAARRVMDSGWYILGEEVSAFESAWADLCGVAHGVGVGNGMDAIELALRSLDIGAGDEVITTSMTAFATVLAIYRAGAIPVLADIDPTTALMSVESAKRCVSSRTRAVILVHLYGQMRQIGSWTEFCAEHRLALVEDCAQAHIASARGRMAGSVGEVAAFSFYPTKNLGALGDAGMIVTNDPGIACRARSLRNYGQTDRYHHPELGMNSRLDELQAALLRTRLKWLTGFTQRRREIANLYRLGMSNPSITLLAEPEEILSHVYHLFVVSCAERAALQSHLNGNGIESAAHYPVPIHKQASCLDIARDPEGLSNSERHAAACVSLPCHPQMTDSDVHTVISVINAFRSS